MEFSDLNELTCFMEMLKPPGKRMFIQSEEEYIDYIEECPVSNLFNSPPSFSHSLVDDNQNYFDFDDDILDKAKDDISEDSEDEEVLEKPISNINIKELVEKVNPILARLKPIADTIKFLFQKLIDISVKVRIHYEKKSKKYYEYNSAMSRILQSSGISGNGLSPLSSLNSHRQSLTVYLIDTKIPIHIGISSDNTVAQATEYIFNLCIKKHKDKVKLIHDSHEGI